MHSFNHHGELFPLGRDCGRAFLVAVCSAAIGMHSLGAQLPSACISALAPAPTNVATPETSLLLAETDIRKGRYTEAIQQLRSLMEASGESWRAHYDLGFALFRLRGEQASFEGNLRESIWELARSLQLNERNADAHKVLGLNLTMIQREDLAGVELAEAVRLAPASAENHYFLGRHFMHESEYSEAAHELKEATELDPDYAKAFENLGITLDRLGLPGEATKDLQRAVDLDQKSLVHSAWPYLDLAQFYHEHGNPRAALPLAQKAVTLNPRSEEALLQVATLYRASEDWQKALDALQKAENLNVNSTETEYLLGRTYKALGDIPKSQQAFRNFDALRKMSEPSPSTPKATEPDWTSITGKPRNLR